MFIERTRVNESEYPDYIIITTTPEKCQHSGSNSIGRKGGKQHIRLAINCDTSTFMHELLHAVGFKHEQSRPDRDTYVNILWENIESGFKHNFDIPLNNYS